MEGQTVTPAEVSQEIIAQAEKLGYRIAHTNEPRMYVDEPLFIKGSFSPFALRSSFVFGPFGTREEANQYLPEIVRCHLRAEKLTENHSVRHRANVGRRKSEWWVERFGGEPVGPFEDPAAALDEAERLADEARRVREGMIEHARQEHIQAIQIPPSFAGIDLDNFDAKTKTLKAALKEARAWTQVFRPHGEYIQNLWLCGPVGRGKTTLACAVAATLAMVGRHALYCTIDEAIHAPDDQSLMNKLRMPELLVLDWTGLTPTGNRASRDQAELLGFVSGRSVGLVLDARNEDTRPTLLVADCDREQLKRCLGNARFERVLRRKIVNL
jgi:DNA replication protein DnaC